MRRSKKKDFSKVIKKQNKSWFHRLVSGAFLAPSVLGVLLFFVLPFLVVIYFSFVNNPVAKKFVGLTNYINVIQNGAFRTAVGNTLFFSVVAVPLAVILGMALAFLLDAGIPLKSELRSCFLTPLMVPTASIVLIWQVLFEVRRRTGGLAEIFSRSFGHYSAVFMEKLRLQYDPLFVCDGKYPKGYYRGGRVGRGKPLADIPAC